MENAVCIPFPFSYLVDALIQSDLQYVQGHSPEEIRVKYLAQGHNIIWHSLSHQGCELKDDNNTLGDKITIIKRRIPHATQLFLMKHFIDKIHAIFW